MLVIKCRDEKLYPFKLKKCGRVKRIFYDQRGRAYYNRGNMRVYLDTVESLSYPYFYEDCHGKERFICGWEYIGAYGCLYIEILEGEEAVQLWEEA